jgi:hypothetical protein
MTLQKFAGVLTADGSEQVVMEISGSVIKHVYKPHDL